MSHPGVNQSRRVFRWRRGKRMMAFASIFLFLLSLTASKPTAAQEANGAGSISGRVTVEGRPAPGLAVVLFPDGYGQTLGPVQPEGHAIASTATDTEGRYRLAGLSAGHYWVRVLAPQYVSTRPEFRLRKDDYATLEAWQLAQGDAVSLGEGKSITDLDLELLPAATLSGRLTDLYGSPVVGEPVYLFGVTRYGVQRDPVWGVTDRNTATDSNGVYRVGGIPPGRYVVGVGEDIARLTGAFYMKNDMLGPRGRVQRAHYYQEVFYPGTPAREEAHVIEIAPAAEVKEINFVVGKLRRSFTARGRVIDAQTGKPLRGKRHISLTHIYGDDHSGGRAGSLAQDQTAADGSFEIDGLLAERFCAGIPFEGDDNLYSEPVEFAVKDADVNGLEIKVYHGLTVSGSVTIEDGNGKGALARLPQLKLRVSQERPADIMRDVPVGADGGFKLVGLRQGPVEISVGFCEVEDYFKISRVEYAKGNDLKRMLMALVGEWPDRYHFDLDKNVASVRVALRYNGASLLCHVNVIGTLPPDMRLQANIYSEAGRSSGGELDANGDVLDEGLEPGRYRISIGDGRDDYTQEKTVLVKKNQQTKVTFTIDASNLRKRDD